MIAADEGYLAIVKTLIAAGYKVNLEDKDGDTALNLGFKTIIKKLS
jgi:ankyrin repeat protein